MNKMYIASCEEDGGIYCYNVKKRELLGFYYLKNPMYMAIENKTMYAVLRLPFDDSDFSGVLSLDIHRNGRLSNPTDLVSTNGECGCHIDVCDGDVYAANYLSGNALKLGGKTVTHSGKGPNTARQDMPHTHQATVSPDKKYVLITDLGIDKIMVYDREMNFVSSADVPKGHGARHIAFSHNKKYVYCVNELESTVSSFIYNKGTLSYIDTTEGLDKTQKVGNTAAAIRVSADDRFVYTSNRGHNSVSCFKSENGKLTLFDVVSCGGDFPRDVNITPNGKLMVCTNENSNDVTFLSINKRTGELKLTDERLSVPHPLCVIFN